eukprot:960891-Karenia_brevis.AAC.1
MALPEDGTPHTEELCSHTEELDSFVAIDPDRVPGDVTIPSHAKKVMMSIAGGPQKLYWCYKLEHDKLQPKVDTATEHEIPDEL